MNLTPLPKECMDFESPCARGQLPPEFSEMAMYDDARHIADKYRGDLEGEGPALFAATMHTFFINRDAIDNDSNI